MAAIGPAALRAYLGPLQTSPNSLRRYLPTGPCLSRTRGALGDVAALGLPMR